MNKSLRRFIAVLSLTLAIALMIPVNSYMDNLIIIPGVKDEETTEETTEKAVEETTAAPETKPVETEPVETVPPETVPVETVPPETVPPETVPVETVPVETVPVETEPVETVPVETVPPETEPVETEQVETEPAEETVENNLRTLRDTEITLGRGTGLVVMTIPGGEYVTGDLSEGEYVEIWYDGINVGFAKAVDLTDSAYKIYASLPVESGEFQIGDGETYFGVSRLVDVAEYNDKLSIPMIIDMKLSHDDPDSLFPRKAFYSRNLCLLQYDAINALLTAQKIFNSYGYTIKIYDAYRPTSVQQSWYNIVRVHKWVASPEYGDGGMHDRGIAVDISLVDIKTGEELDMPTAMHTFSDDSARSSTSWTAEQTKNSNLLTSVMVSCGFTTISSEWWHFQLADKNSYLPTDHPLDDVPLVAYK